MRYQWLTEDEMKFIKANYREHSPKVIAEIIGRAAPTIYRYLRSMNLEPLKETDETANNPRVNSPCKA